MYDGVSREVLKDEVGDKKASAIVLLMSKSSQNFKRARKHNTEELAVSYQST